MMTKSKLETLKQIKTLDASFNFIVATFAASNEAAIENRVQELNSRIGKLDALAMSAGSQDAKDAIHRCRALCLVTIADLKRGYQNLTLTKAESESIGDVLDPVERHRMAGEIIRLRPQPTN